MKQIKRDTILINKFAPYVIPGSALGLYEAV